MQPIVFLDFDGPIRTARCRAAGYETDPVAVRAIHNALRDAGAKLVVISSWRHAGREDCLRILDAVPGFELSPFLHLDWCVGGHDNHPAAQSRGQAINEWLIANEGSWSDSLVIDDYLIQRFWPAAKQVFADVTEGMNNSMLQRLAEWGAEWRARR